MFSPEQNIKPRENHGSGDDFLEDYQLRRERLESDIHFDHMSFDRYSRELERLRELLNSKKNSLVTRILEYHEIHRIREILGIVERIRIELEANIEKKKEWLQFYDEIIEQQEALRKTEREASGVSRTRADVAENGVESENQLRAVSNIMLKNNCLFFHSIAGADEFKPSGNNATLDTKKLSIKDQIRIFHSVAPTSSCFSLREDTDDDVFSSREIGLLVAGGRVLAGSDGDMGTTADGFFNRKFDDKFASLDSIRESINRGRFVTNERYVEADERVHSHEASRDGHNELVIESPESIGVVFFEDHFIDKPDPRFFSSEYIVSKFSSKEFDQDSENKVKRLSRQVEDWWKKAEDLAREGIPIFVVNGRNQLYALHGINVDNKTFLSTPKLGVEDIVDGPYRNNTFTSKEKKRLMMEHLLDLKTSDSLKETIVANLNNHGEV